MPSPDTAERFLAVMCILSAALASGCFPLGGSTRSFNSDGVEIAYRDVGNGDPLLLLHGFGMNGRLQWAHVAEELAEEWRLIIPDHRGHGVSDKPEGVDAYGQHMIDDTVRLLDHLGLEQVRVAGMSMGGFMAVKAIADYPDRFRCGFVAASGWMDPSRVDNVLSEDIAEAFEEGRGFAVLNRRLNPESKGGSWIGEFIFELLIGRQEPQVLASVYRGMRELAVDRDDLKEFATPLRVIVGRQDGLLPAAIELVDQVGTAELEVLPGRDHGSIDSAPRFVPSMLEFFGAHEHCRPTRQARKTAPHGRANPS